MLFSFRPLHIPKVPPSRLLLSPIVCRKDNVRKLRRAVLRGKRKTRRGREVPNLEVDVRAARVDA